MAASALPPVVDPLYCVQEPTVLILKEKLWSWTGDEACISDHTGRTWFKVNPKLFSLREKRTIFDVNGAAAFSLKKKTWSMHSTWRMYKGASFDKSALLCDIKMGLMASMTGLGSVIGAKLKIYFNDGDKKVDYYAKGNFRSKKFNIFKAGAAGDVEVAKISKESKWTSLEAYISQSEFDAHTYFMEMQAGADAAFLTALAIVIDENLRDDQPSAKHGGGHGAIHHHSHGTSHHGSSHHGSSDHGGSHHGGSDQGGSDHEGGSDHGGSESVSSSDVGGSSYKTSSDGGGWFDDFGDDNNQEE